MLNAISSKLFPYMPAMPRLATPKEVLDRVAKISYLAIGSFAILAMAHQAEAGPVAYAACVTECLALTLGGFAPACLAACAPFLAAPTP